MIKTNMCKVLFALVAMAVFTAMATTTETSETTTWTGESSENWYDPQNWTNGVPDANTNVNIPGCPEMPFFPNIEAAAAVNHLTLEDGAYLLDNGNLTINGTFTMKRGNLKIPHDWRMISAPVNGKTIVGSDFVPTTDNWGEAGSRTFDFYAFDETMTRADGSPTPPWVNIRNAPGTVNSSFETEFQPGKGYLVAYNNNYPGTTFHFTGTMNTGSVTIPLTYTEDAHPDNRGWNLIGNPFPSGYLWNGAEYDNLKSDFASRYDHRVNNYTHSSRMIIPPNQGFFVRVAEGGGSITFLEANRIDAGTFIKSQETDAMMSQETEEAIVFSFGSGERIDRTTIRIAEGARFESDRRDAFKLFSLSPVMPQIYTLATDGERMAVNAIPDLPEELVIPAGIRVPETGPYTISVEALSGRFANMEVLLVDHETNTETTLSKNSRYDFVAHTKHDEQPSPRFQIRLRLSGVPTGHLSARLHPATIYVHENTIHVVFYDHDRHRRRMEVFDLYGRLIASHQLNHGTRFQKQLDVVPGIYLVRVSDHNGFQTERIIVK